MKHTPSPSTHNLGALSSELIAKGKQYYTPNYKPREMILDRGRGATLWDVDGNDYIDLAAGIAVCSLGHHDPDLLAALHAQAEKLWHTSNVFFTEPPILLAEALVKHSCFAQRVYLCNSGAEANEAAIKLVRKYAADKGRPPEAREIISFAGSFHGRTLATVTATAQPKYQQGFEPLPGGFIYCDRFNDEAAIDALVSERTAAILVEPVQGEGGVMPAKAGFLQHLRALCDKVGALLVVDEIQAGMGRTGSLFAHCQDGVIPDIVTLAKALGGGLPIGAMLVGAKAAETFQFGSHGSTFGGNPVMAAVALAAVTKLARQDVLTNVADRSEQLRARLSDINTRLGIFKEIRGRGLMIGAELHAPWAGNANAMADAARTSGVLVLIAGPNVMRFLPPLTITSEELETGLSRLESALIAYKDAYPNGA
jgi:acetylornithine/N-succinyldiaminopimelate aminotransferase